MLVVLQMFGFVFLLDVMKFVFDGLMLGVFLIDEEFKFVWLYMVVIVKLVEDELLFEDDVEVEEDIDDD